MALCRKKIVMQQPRYCRPNTQHHLNSPLTCYGRPKMWSKPCSHAGNEPEKASSSKCGRTSPHITADAVLGPTRRQPSEGSPSYRILHARIRSVLSVQVSKQAVCKAHMHRNRRRPRGQPRSDVRRQAYGFAALRRHRRSSTGVLRPLQLQLQ